MSLVTIEQWRSIQSMKRLKHKVALTDKDLTESLIPEMTKLLEENDIDAARSLINLLPECATRMKLAALVAAFEKVVGI